MDKQTDKTNENLSTDDKTVTDDKINKVNQENDDKKMDWKSEARKWESRSKENYEKALKLDEIEEASKTEQQKLSDKLEKVEKEYSALQQKTLRNEIISEYNLPAVLAKRLSGETQEELEADAKELASLIEELPKQKPAVKPVSIQGLTAKTSSPKISSREELEEALRNNK